jgi:hypothetical protein
MRRFARSGTGIATEERANPDLIKTNQTLQVKNPIILMFIASRSAFHLYRFAPSGMVGPAFPSKPAAPPLRAAQPFGRCREANPIP